MRLSLPLRPGSLACITWRAALCGFFLTFLSAAAYIYSFRVPFMTVDALGKGISALEATLQSENLMNDARMIEEYLYWGGFLATENSALTSGQVYEIGKAIKEYSSLYGLSPSLIVAVIKVESGGRLRAVSPRGAVGLMQVMPFWTKEFGAKKDDLFKIDTNIRIGSYVLSGFIRKWGYREGLYRYYRGGKAISGEGYVRRIETAIREMHG